VLPSPGVPVPSPVWPHPEFPSGVPLHGTVEAPPSKSHAIRLLIAAALADGVSRITGVPRNDDTRAVAGALRALGIGVDADGDALVVTGKGGRIPRPSADLDLGGSGTGLRFLFVLCALGRGPYTLSGDPSLLARPVDATAAVVRALGARVELTGGGLPVRVHGLADHTAVPDVIEVDVTRSSQPLSALGLVAAALPAPVRAITSAPAAECASLGYVDLTREVVTQNSAATWRAAPAEDGRVVHRIDGHGYTPIEARVEGDWSSAAFLLAAAAVSGGRVTVAGLDPVSVQPDRRIATLLIRMGADVSFTPDAVVAVGANLRGVRVDLRGAPDLAPLMGALACIAEGETVVGGAAHLRDKESDRIAAVVAAARAIGCHAAERPDGFVVRGGTARAGLVDARGDHRIAMAFALVGLAVPGVRVADETCVAKSYPGYWDALASLL